jgi:hypothetical protein
MNSINEIIKKSPIKLYSGRYAVVKCNKLPVIDALFMISNDGEEITAISEENNLKNISYDFVEKWFKIISIDVSTPFHGVGFLAAISNKIAEKGINILIISTFSKEFILLKEEDTNQGMKLLKKMGFPIL